MNFRGAGFIYC